MADTSDDAIALGRFVAASNGHALPATVEPRPNNLGWYVACPCGAMLLVDCEYGGWAISGGVMRRWCALSEKHGRRRRASMKIPVKPCQRCGVRWRQDGELCRSCARDAGQTIPTTRTVEASRVHRDAARIAALRPAERAPVQRRVVVDGEEFDVVWNG